MENQRAVTVLFIVGGLLAGVFVRSLSGAVIEYAHLPNPLVVGIALPAILGAISGGATSIALLRTERARAFTDDVVTELQRVTWPTREETLGNTGIVVSATLFFASLLSAYDFLWARLTGIFLYTTG